eukprot:412023_1
MATNDIAGELLKLSTNHLAKQMENNETKNVTFIFNEDPTNKGKISVTLTANRGLLSLLSPVFRKMFSNGMKESLDDDAIEIKDVDSQSFESFIQYFYMRPQIKASNVAVLSYLADKYLVEGLQKSCQLFMDKCVTLNNIVQIIESSLKYQQTKLVGQCQKWLEKVSEETPSNVIYALFESDICNDISVKAANVLLFSFGDSIDPQVLWKWIIKWNDANHDQDDEKQDNNNLDKLKAIVTSFPFSSLSVSILTNEVIPKKILSQEKIIDILSKKCEKYENSHQDKEYSTKIIPLKFGKHNLENYKICSAFGTTTIYRKIKVDEHKLSIVYANIGMIEGNVYKWKTQIIHNSSYGQVGIVEYHQPLFLENTKIIHMDSITLLHMDLAIIAMGHKKKRKKLHVTFHSELHLNIMQSKQH